MKTKNNDKILTLDYSRNKIKSDKLFKLWGVIVFLVNSILKRLGKTKFSTTKLYNGILKIWNVIVITITTKFDFSNLWSSCYDSKYTCSIWHRPMPKPDTRFSDAYVNWGYNRKIEDVTKPYEYDAYARKYHKTFKDKDKEIIEKIRKDMSDIAACTKTTKITCPHCGNVGKDPLTPIYYKKENNKIKYWCCGCSTEFSRGKKISDLKKQSSRIKKNIIKSTKRKP